MACFSWRLKGIGWFCFSPSVFLKIKSFLLVFVGDEQPGEKELPVIWPLLVACKQTLYSKLLDVFGRLFRTLKDGKIVDAHFHLRGGSYSPFRLTIPSTLRHSLHLFSNDIAKFHLPRFVSGSVAEVETEQEPHRT